LLTPGVQGHLTISIEFDGKKPLFVAPLATIRSGDRHQARFAVASINGDSESQGVVLCAVLE